MQDSEPQSVSPGEVGETTNAVLGAGGETFNEGDIVRLADDSMFHNMFAVVVGQREFAESPNHPTVPWLDVKVNCQHTVKHNHTVKVSLCTATGGAV